HRPGRRGRQSRRRGRLRRAGEIPVAGLRAGWIRALHPGVAVHVVADICDWHGQEPCPPRCSRAWAAHLARAGLGPWTHVYGSDPYVPSFAVALGAQPVLIDPERRRTPLSGSAVRADLAAHWRLLHPVVRAGLVRRVVIVGAESTGTTTLARDLAARFSVPLVPEHGRAVSEVKAAAAGSIWDVTWTGGDFDLVAGGQEQLEDEAIGVVVQHPGPAPALPYGPVIVCDTDVLATAIWHRRYLGRPAPHLVARAGRRPPLLYVLTSHERVAFHQDGLRDGEAMREAMTGWFRAALAAQAAPWIEVRGDPVARVDEVAGWLDRHAGPAVHTAPA
ncbi:MAG: AAA family ATPase, partial [Acidimicrobiia bacterium]